MKNDDTNLELLCNDLKNITGLAYFNCGELITLCPNCETDRYNTNRKHGHLYISVQDPIFKCFRCNFSGIIFKLLSKFNLNTKDYYGDSLLTYNWSKTDTDKFVNRECNDEVTLPHLNFLEFPEKEKYLYDRIFNFDKTYPPKELVLNIKEFIKLNNIQLNKDDSFINFLQNNFVGFLSTRKSILICRNIDETSDFRYYKINLKDIYFKDFFSYKFDNTNNKVVLCEGIFDLFNIVSNPNTKHIIKDANIISCSLNKEFKRTLISTLDYIKILYADVIIFSDKDVKEYEYMNIYFNNTVKSLTLYYNEYGKDFGTKSINPIKIPINKYIKRK